MENKKLRLVACDMDGTLLNNNKELPEEFIPWVISHPGVRVVIASGRQYETLRRDFAKIEDSLYFIAENGALVFNKGKLIHIEYLQRELFFEALSIVEKVYGVAPIICGAKAAYMKRASHNAMSNADMYYKKLLIVDDLREATADDRVVKIACFLDDCDKEELIEHFGNLDKSLEWVISGDEWVDISKRGVNKGAGIVAVQEKYGISPEESMAFGDYMNDIQLLQACEESYAMENAHPDVKAIAKHIAPANEENGVMKTLLANEDMFAV